ncbi:hypothetical protein B0H14DRAFT_2566618 [Mycena olivaceomarginata]|nr:hypothetical protein B0H14DRAFT_2566618 [Mycena olivaceomarginata]
MLPSLKPRDRKVHVMGYPGEFIQPKPHKGKFNEYEFRWPNCDGGTVFRSPLSDLPALMLRTHFGGRKFLEAFRDATLTAKMVRIFSQPIELFPRFIPHISTVCLPGERPHHNSVSWASYWSRHHDLPDNILASMRTPANYYGPSSESELTTDAEENAHDISLPTSTKRKRRSQDVVKDDDNDQDDSDTGDEKPNKRRCANQPNATSKATKAAAAWDKEKGEKAKKNIDEVAATDTVALPG